MTEEDNARFLVAKYPDWKRAPLSHEDVLHKELYFGRKSVKQSLNRHRLEHNDHVNSDSSDDDDYVGDTDEAYRVDARENSLYAKVIYWGISEDVTWENICDRTAINILAHISPKTMDELRQLKGVMDESMIETYGERVLETLRKAN